MTDDAKTLLGGIFVGDASPYASLRPLLGTQLSSEPAAYLSASGMERARGRRAARRARSSARATTSTPAPSATP